jgi:serine/threonine protein kinase
MRSLTPAPDTRNGPVIEPKPSPPAGSDRNLLFGILAVQMDFIDREALIQGMNAWVLDKAKMLGQILLEQGALRHDTHALLEALVEKHLEMHGQDAEKSLASLSSLGSVRKELQQIADPDLHKSLAHVSAARRAGQDEGATPDPDATPLPPSAGQSSSPGLRFRILRPHAKGGLGQVYVAHDEELHREVALKEIQTQHAFSPESRSRFLLEAEVTGGLEHPGIVPVYGLGKYADGRPFYAMRFIRGGSLQEAIARFHRADKKGRNPWERSLALRQLLGRFIDVCNAIAYAHSRSVLHRDLKPGNIMLGQYGETLVVDWGLAKPLGQPESAWDRAEAPLRPRLGSGVAATQVGEAFGTPAYMSPEQASGRLDLLGPASDIYSLGATLYCLLAGQAPFTEPDQGAVLQKVQKGDYPPPRQIKRTVPRALEAICLTAMALKPEDRYSSARALADDIEHWLADEPVSCYREPWGKRATRWARYHRTGILTSGALALVSLVSLTALLLVRSAWESEHAEGRRADENAKTVIERTEAALKAAKGQLEEAKKLAGQHPANIRRQEITLRAMKDRLTLSFSRYRLTFFRLRQNVQGRTPTEVLGALSELYLLEKNYLDEDITLQGLLSDDPALAVRRAEAEVAAAQSRLEWVQLAATPRATLLFGEALARLRFSELEAVLKGAKADLAMAKRAVAQQAVRENGQRLVGVIMNRQRERMNSLLAEAVRLAKVDPGWEVEEIAVRDKVAEFQGKILLEELKLEEVKRNDLVPGVKRAEADVAAARVTFRQALQDLKQHHPDWPEVEPEQPEDKKPFPPLATPPAGGAHPLPAPLRDQEGEPANMKIMPAEPLEKTDYKEEHDAKISTPMPPFEVMPFPKEVR